jgi:formylmethanofuran dehydrogenase subunit E
MMICFEAIEENKVGKKKIKQKKLHGHVTIYYIMGYNEATVNQSLI